MRGIWHIPLVQIELLGCETTDQIKVPGRKVVIRHFDCWGIGQTPELVTWEKLSGGWVTGGILGPAGGSEAGHSWVHCFFWDLGNYHLGLMFLWKSVWEDCFEVFHLGNQIAIRYRIVFFFSLTKPLKTFQWTFLHRSKRFWQALASLLPLDSEMRAWMLQCGAHGAGSIQPCSRHLAARLDKACGCVVPVASSRLLLGEISPHCCGRPEIMQLESKPWGWL